MQEALAIQHGLELVSADRGFARFHGLRFRNPLAEKTI
jgi:predicted nucleic acid-binding protein